MADDRPPAWTGNLLLLTKFNWIWFKLDLIQFRLTSIRWLMTGLLHGLAIFFVIITSPFSLFFVIHRVGPLIWFNVLVFTNLWDHVNIAVLTNDHPSTLISTLSCSITTRRHCSTKKCCSHDAAVFLFGHFLCALSCWICVGDTFYLVFPSTKSLLATSFDWHSDLIDLGA